MRVALVPYLDRQRDILPGGCPMFLEAQAQPLSNLVNGDILELVFSG
jgi:hypothetical protein